MAESRSIAVRLRAEVDSFVSAMGRAGRALGQVGDTGEKTSRQQQSAMSRLAQHARENEQAWTSVGRSLMVVGGAITAFGGALLGAGIQYNALRQKATQSLTAVTGSTEEAAEQMRRLDEYGQNSWLMRDTLIRAQQTMTGFGIETGKVIPYMDALAEATAATGGSNQDFEEMALLMGQIQSQGKITATELMRFGVRGVDAAQLIGDAMGMTAGEIRESITAGTLDAGTALDALAQGMKERYNGASDLVRNTFEGAFADVKAAFRDLGAELATPLVNPEGGGLLVDWLNNLADAMRAFRDAPNWVKYGVAGLGALAGAGTLLGGSAMVLVPRLVELYDNLGRLGRVGQTAQRGLRATANALPNAARVAAVGAGFAALTVGAAKLYDHFSDARLPAGIERTTAALLGLDGLNINSMFDFGTASSGFDDLGSAAERLLSGGFDDRLNRWAGSIGRSLGIENNTWGNAATQFEQVGDALASLVNQGDADRAAALFESLYAQVDQSKISSEEFMSLMPSYGAALDGLAVDAELAGDGMGDLAGGTSDAQAAMEAAREANEQLRAEVAQSVGGLVDWTGGIAAADFSLRDWTQSLEDQIEKLRNFDSNMTTVFDRVSDIAGEDAARQIADRLRQMGDEGVAAADALAAASDGDLQRAIEALLGLEDQAGNTSSSLADLIAPEINIDTTKAARELAAFTAMMAATGGTIPVDADMDGATDDVVQWGNSLVGTTVPVDADTAGAAAELAAWAAMVAATNSVAGLDADPSSADGEVADWVEDARNTEGTALLGADDDPAQGTLTAFGGSAARARVVVPLRADDKPARNVTTDWERWAGARNPEASLGAQDRKARATTNTFTRWAGSLSPKTNLGADDKEARGTTNAFASWAGRRSPKVDLGAQDRKARNTTTGLTKWMNRRSGRVGVGANDSSARKTVNNLIASIGKRSTSITVNAKKGKGPSVAGFAMGGPIHGPGTGTSDSILAALSNGEHIWTAREVKALGGHGAMAALRQSVLSGEVRGFANGGAVESPRYVVPNVTVASPAMAAPEGRSVSFNVDRIVAADPRAAAAAFSREVQYQMMGAR